MVQNGGLVPLLGLLESKHLNLQHNAAFALYGLADNEDNIADIIREGKKEGNSIPLQRFPCNTSHVPKP